MNVTVVIATTGKLMHIDHNRQTIIDIPPPLRLLEFRRDQIVLLPLPEPYSPLIGREHDLAKLSILVQAPETRLTTVTGAGGIGKSRLAIEIAACYARETGEEAGFLSLSHIQEQNQIAGAISSYLKLATCSAESLLDFLATALKRPMLLVLDNFEQVLDGGPFLISLLAANPLLKMLVTSRARLRVRGEHEYHLGPLRVESYRSNTTSPGARDDSPAIALFIARALEVSPNIQMTAERTSAIAEICKELDGFPLAIELAAARCRLMPPEAMLPLLRSRLSFLTGGPRDAPKRHQTVRNTIQWTYDLLPVRSQKLFRFLSAFPGGFTFEAAAMVGAGLVPQIAEDDITLIMLEEIETLADFSLLRELEPDSGQKDDSRFMFYETIRTFGLEKLKESGEQERAFQLLERWSLGLSEDALETRYTAVSTYFDSLEKEYPNIRASIEWLESKGEARRGFKILHGLAWFMTERYLLSEAIKWSSAFLATPEIKSDPRSYAEALNTSALIHYWCSNYDESRRLHEQALSIWRSLKDNEKTAQSLLNLANNVFDSNDLELASNLLQESIELWLVSGNKQGHAHASTILGRILLAKGDIESARDHYNIALNEFVELNHLSWVAFAHEGLGLLALVEGDNETAFVQYRSAMSMALDFNDYWRICCCLLGFAELARRVKAFALSARLYAAAESNLLAMELEIRKTTRQLFTNWFSQLRGQMDQAAFSAYWEEGSHLNREEASALALTFDPDVHHSSPPKVINPKGDPIATNDASLTPRETEILILLSRGLSNREIAERLSISHRTVMQHLSNIFPKIDVTSRTAASAWAHHHNIV